MDSVYKVIGGILVIGWCLFCAKSCGDCWNQGGQPVQGMVGVVCVK